MITILAEYKNNKINNIEISGHANYNVYGNDIVCAAASTLSISTINSVLSLNDESISYTDDGNILNISIVQDDENTQKILNNMIDMFQELEEQYPKNILLKKLNSN